MSGAPALELPLQSQALHYLYSRNGVKRRTRFIERAPEWLLRKLVDGAQCNDTAQYVLTGAVTDVVYLTTADDISKLTENQKMYDYNRTSMFCDLADWYYLFPESSLDDFVNHVQAVYRNIVASTNDFSPSAVKAKFLIHYLRLDCGISHDEYNDVYQFLKDHIDAVGKRLSIVLAEASSGGGISLDGIKALVETPLALSDGLL